MNNNDEQTDPIGAADKEEVTELQTVALPSETMVQVSELTHGSGHAFPVHNASEMARKHQKTKRRALLALSCTFVAVLMCFIAGFVIVTSTKYIILGIKVEDSTTQVGLEKQLQARVAPLTIQVTGGTDITGTKFAYADAGVAIDTTKTAKKVMEQKANATVIEKLQWWKPNQISPIVVVDQTKLGQFVATNTVSIIEQAVDASLVVTDEQITISPSKNGSELLAKDAKKMIENAAKAGKPAHITMVRQVLPPHITTAAAETIKQQAETALQKPISFTIGTETFTPTKAIVASWIDSIGTDADKPKLQFSKDRIVIYLDRIATNYVDLPKDEVAITGEDGEKHVYVSGRNGTDIAAKEDLASAVATELILAPAIAKTVQIGPKTFGTITPDYPKWVLVSLDGKWLHAYEHNTLVKEIKVSAGAPATPTVTGLFKIRTKVRKQDMRGLNADGTRYLQPDVEWVNYFYKDYALHGNYWRPTSWFGTKNGSHGCVGMLNPDAKWVYNWAPVGTTVIVY